MVSCLTYFRVEFNENFCVKDFCESLKLTKNEVDYSSEKMRLIIGRNERFNINVNEMLRVTLKDLLGKEELLFALEAAFAFDYSLLIEEYLPDKRDINCAAYAVDGKIFVSECEEPLSAEQIFSFREKYLASGKTRKRNFPAKLPEGVAQEVKRITERLYKELNFSGMVRADFLLSGGKLYFNEMNTVPGSLSYYLFTEKFTGAKKLFCELIEEAMAQAAARRKSVNLTGILKEVKTVSGKRAGK